MTCTRAIRDPGADDRLIASPPPMTSRTVPVTFVRAAIEADRFVDFRREFLAGYETTGTE